MNKAGLLPAFSLRNPPANRLPSACRAPKHFAKSISSAAISPFLSRLADLIGENAGWMRKAC